MNKNNYFVPSEFLLNQFNKRFLKELDFIISKYNDGSKYSIGIINKGYLRFDDKRMFLPDDYFYFLSEDNKTSEIIFNPLENNESNCSFLVLKDGINSKLSQFVNVIFRIVIDKKLSINIERNSRYTINDKYILELPSINKYTPYKWKNIYDIINSILFSKDIISFSFEYSDNSQTAQVKFDYPLYKYLLQLQDNTIFGIKLSDSEMEFFRKIYEIFIIDIFEKAFMKSIKVPNYSNKFSKFYIFVKFYLEINEFLLRDFNLKFSDFKMCDVDEVINNLNRYEKDFYIDRIEEIKKLDKEAYENELKIREESKSNWFLLKDNIVAKKRDLINQEEINKRFNNEYLNTYNQKLALYFARKDAELEIFNRKYMKNNLDFQIILHMQRLALQIIEGDGGLLFFDTRNKKYYFRSYN